MRHTARTEVRGTIEARASTAEIDAAIVATAAAQGHPEVTPDLDLYGCDDDHPVWNVIDAAVDALRPRIAAVVTDQVVLAGSMFDPGSIARFVVENAADDLRCEVFLVVDHWNRETAPLIEWARSLRLKIAGLSATRNESYSQYDRVISGIARRSYERVIVADLYYESSDPRVTVYRKVTR